MARAGRPADGLNNVERLEGDAMDKERLRILLATITGEMTTEEACERLGVGRSRLFELRTQALQGALEAARPKRPGRQAQIETPDQARIRELEEEVDELKVQIEAERVRTQLALAVPEVLISQPPEETVSKTAKKKRKLKRKEAKVSRRRNRRAA